MRDLTYEERLISSHWAQCGPLHFIRKISKNGKWAAKVYPGEGEWNTFKTQREAIAWVNDVVCRLGKG